MAGIVAPRWGFALFLFAIPGRRSFLACPGLACEGPLALGGGAEVLRDSGDESLLLGLCSSVVCSWVFGGLEQIEFKGERLDMSSVRRWRERALKV